MKLRDVVPWPPSWTSSYGSGTTFDTSGDGSLSRIDHLPAQGTLPDRLRLEMERAGNSFSTIIETGSRRDNVNLHMFLQKQIGRTIRDIGEMEFEETVKKQ